MTVVGPHPNVPIVVERQVADVCAPGTFASICPTTPIAIVRNVRSAAPIERV